jgi:hypothetical protein
VRHGLVVEVMYVSLDERRRIRRDSLRGGGDLRRCRAAERGEHRGAEDQDAERFTAKSLAITAKPHEITMS